MFKHLNIWKGSIPSAIPKVEFYNKCNKIIKQGAYDLVIIPIIIAELRRLKGPPSGAP